MQYKEMAISPTGKHCVKSVRPRIFTFPFFLVFKLHNAFSPNVKNYEPEKFRILTHFTQWN